MKSIYSIFALFLCFSLFSQEYFDQLPENPESGKCYAKCIVPDEYKEETIQVLTRPAHKTLEIVPAVYKTEVKEVIVRPASKRFIYQPAVYKSVVDTVWVKDPYHQLRVVPASFSTAEESVEVFPKSGSWVAGEDDPNCPSINPADCRVFHYRESPAVVRSISVKRLKSPTTTQSMKVIGNYKLIPKQVEVTPAKTREELIPQQTKKIERSVLVQNETTREIEVPAEYAQVVKKVLVKKGGMTAWREVPCTLPEQVGVVPIHYASGSAALTNESKRLIDKHILSILVNDSSSVIEIGSHTDSQGGEAFNQQLSEKRAKGVVDYLIGKGIKSDRLIAVGYGESKLLNDCDDSKPCSPAQHAKNRRTEFKVF